MDYKTKILSYEVFAKRGMQNKESGFSINMFYKLSISENIQVDLAYHILKFMDDNRYICTGAYIFFEKCSIENLKVSDIKRIIDNNDLNWIREKLRINK